MGLYTYILAIIGAAVGALQPAPSRPVPLIPPVAPRIAHDVRGPENRIDPYYWLRDDTRRDPRVLAYLRAENAYADAVMAPLRPLRSELLAEMTQLVDQDDFTAPVRDNGYYYYSRTSKGQDYPVVARRARMTKGRETILLDEQAMASHSPFFTIGDWLVSRNNRLLAYTEDRVGRRQYTVRIKDLASGSTLRDHIDHVRPTLAWGDDDRTVYYVENDPITLLSKRVKAHVLGTRPADDKLVYEEKDESFYLELGRTSDRKFICIYERSTVSNEQRCAKASDPRAFELIAPRQRGFHYRADHVGARWIIRTDWKAKNYRLVEVSDSRMRLGRKAWRDLVAANPNVFIEGFHPMRDFVAIEERADANKRIRLLSYSGESREIASDEAAYAMSIDANPEVDSTKLRYTYDSLTTPQIIYEVDYRTGSRTVLKRTPAPSYVASRYVTERVWITARDGTKVPVSLVYRKGLKRDGTAPMLQYGYGSYGLSLDPKWSPTIVPLLDRGVLYAIVHIRGGQEMGSSWYDSGRLMSKKNSFTDFIDATRSLVREGYARKDGVAGLGRSAGGLLMGAVANMAPADYTAILSEVPFVDVVTSMLDTSIPLTTVEYDEWGNPNTRPFYDYMLSYSPYDNVTRQPYPAMFLSTGLWDSQVQYWEPAKYVAKLRATKTDRNPLVFRINMKAGHTGQSARKERLASSAEMFAFMLTQLGINA